MDKDIASHSEDDWKKKLSAEEFYVCRQKGTERAFTGKYWDHHEEGFYECVACHQPLFPSETKYDSGTGWPSFFSPIKPDCVLYEEDFELGVKRVEVLCSKCRAHLGHVFPDGPKETGLRYCLNSVALRFIPKKKDSL